MVLSASQYFGSVTTLTFGIPGENTSLPLLAIRSHLLDDLKTVHFLCAAGSLFASIISAVILFLLIEVLRDVVFYIKSYFALICAIVGLGLCLKYSDNTFVVSLFLIIFGWTVGKVGYNHLSNTAFLSFDNSFLYGGIPILPALLGMYALPNLYKLSTTLDQFSPIKANTNATSSTQFKNTLAMMPVMFRSTIIGFFSGLIPYIGNSLSSYLAFMFEKKIHNQNYKSLAVAAESANNSANLSVLIPLLALGVAIVPSEFVLLEIVNSTRQVLSWTQIFAVYDKFIITLILGNIICFFLAWIAVDYIVKIFHYTKMYFIVFLFLLVVVSIFMFGLEYSQEYYYLIVFCVFSIFGFLMRQFDLLPFVYAFLLQNNIEEIVYRVYNIYL